jgi:hypothetical protein
LRRLFRLEHERTLLLQRREAASSGSGTGSALHALHVRAPRRVAGQMCERAERDRDRHHGQRDGPSLPALSPSPEKWRQSNCDDRD